MFDRGATPLRAGCAQTGPNTATVAEARGASIRGLCGHLRAPRTRMLQMVRSSPRPRHPPPSRCVMKRTAPYLSNHALGRELTAAIAREDISTAVVLDHIAEYDERKLYRPAGYPSMFAYCVESLHRSEEAAYKRIRAARAARRFPVIFDMVAEGRLHLSGVVLLAAHLTADNAAELLALASHRSKLEI